MPTGTLVAAPNPCVLSAAGTCSTTLTWTTSGTGSATLWVRAGGGTAQLVAQATSGSVTAPWITAAGDVFELRAGPSATDSLLASVNVTGVR
jgi:hypothetical protein